MTRVISKDTLTPADELRSLLNETDKRAVSIRGAGPENARELLDWLDHIHELFPQLEAAGMDLAPERNQWGTVQGSVRRHEGSLRQELKPLGGLATLRAELDAPPPPERWWWRLDEIATRRRNKRLTSTATIIIALIALFFVGRWLFGVFFPVDPAVIESYRLQLDAEQQVDEGNLESALALFEQAETHMPQSRDVLIWLAVLNEELGNAEKSQTYIDRLHELQEASAVAADLANIYLRFNRLDRSLDFAQQAIELDPDHAGAYLTAGSVYAEKGDYLSARLAFEQASAAAERADQPELQALARMRLGILLQSAPIAPPTP